MAPDFGHRVGKKLTEHEVEMRFPAVWHTESNQSERILKELSKCVVYIVTYSRDVGHKYCDRLSSS